MEEKFDIAVVGGGVLGSFHAYHALNMGYRVCLLEKDSHPRGATTQNFGQVVPSGMNTIWQAYGRESLSIYKELQSRFDITVRQHGSIYLASDEEEEQLLVELHAINKDQNYPSTLLGQRECIDRYPGLRTSYVRAGLYFPEEITVEPRTMIHRLHQYLLGQMGLSLKSRFLAVGCEQVNGSVLLTAADGRTVTAAKVFVCTGADFKTLFPDEFQQSELEVSKLQMMQTRPQPGYQLKGSVLTGWSIRRYESFRECPSYAGIKARESSDSPQKRWGVHILFKQAADGSVIIGDSHEYADAGKEDHLSYDLNMEIDNFIIEEAQKIFQLPTFEIQRRWSGTYAQCKHKDVFLKTIADHIHIVTGIGGKGMTGSAGFARQHVDNVLNG